MKIELYGYPTSPYVNKVSSYLAYKNIDYTFIGVDPIKSQELAFTNQKRVPVLKVDDEWMTESTDIGLWLDELYPDRPLIPNENLKEEIMRVEEWTHNRLVPFIFLKLIRWDNTYKSIKTGWRLASEVHKASSLPLWVRLLWPLLLRKAKFIQNGAKLVDCELSNKELEVNLIQEFLAFFRDSSESNSENLFVGACKTPTLADLSAYAILELDARMGYQSENSPWFKNDRIAKWKSGVESFLQEDGILARRD